MPRSDNLNRIEKIAKEIHAIVEGVIWETKKRQAKELSRALKKRILQRGLLMERESEISDIAKTNGQKHQN